MILLIQKRSLKIAGVVLAICLAAAAIYQCVEGVRQSRAVLAEQAMVSLKTEQQNQREKEEEIIEDNTLDGLKTEWKMQREQEQDEWEHLLAYAQDETVRKNAQQQLYNAIAERRMEIQSEQMLAAKNYNDVMVMIEGDQLTVILGAMFHEKDGMIVAEMLERNTEFAAENIIVILKAGA